jgi:ribosomal protein L35
MSKAKTNKSLKKRVSITGTGKIMKRSPHQNHFNAKESGNVTRGKRKNKQSPLEVAKGMKFLLNI